MEFNSFKYVVGDEVLLIDLKVKGVILATFPGGGRYAVAYYMNNPITGNNVELQRDYMAYEMLPYNEAMEMLYGST